MLYVFARDGKPLHFIKNDQRLSRFEGLTILQLKHA